MLVIRVSFEIYARSYKANNPDDPESKEIEVPIHPLDARHFMEDVKRDIETMHEGLEDHWDWNVDIKNVTTGGNLFPILVEEEVNDD